nr:MAG: capsid protein [Cressdnaviricota sp.]
MVKANLFSTPVSFKHTPKRNSTAARAGTKRKLSFNAGTPAKKRAKTSTKTVTKKKEKILRSPASGLSHSGFYLKMRKSLALKMYEKLGATNTYEINGYAGIGCSVGTQLTKQLYGLNNYPDWSAFFNQSLQYLTAGGAATSSAGLVAKQRSFKMAITTASVKICYTNQSDGDLILDIYDLIAKRDRAQSVDCTTDWQNGLTDQQGTAGAAGLNYYWGAVPTTSKLFNQEWTIKKRTSVELGPGRTHEHMVVLHINKIVDSEIFSQFASAQTPYLMKGISYANMIVGRGMPVDDGGIAAGTITVGNISTSPCKVVTVGHLKYTGYLVASTARNALQSGAFQTVTKAQIIQEGSGALVDQLVAGTMG